MSLPACFESLARGKVFWLVSKKKKVLKTVYTRLHAEDVELLTKLASDNGTTVAQELRVLVRKTLRGVAVREVVLVKEPR